MISIQSLIDTDSMIILIEDSEDTESEDKSSETNSELYKCLN